MTKLARHKFSDAGSARSFAGNTILCHIDEQSAARAVLEEIEQALLVSDLTSCLAVLPAASHHVTIFDCISDQKRRSDAWPRDLPIDTPIEACHAYFARVLGAFDLGLDPPLRLRARPPAAQTRREAILLEPADDAENRRLRELRDRLAAALGLRRPDHEHYEFHVSLTYVYAVPGSEQESRYTQLHGECVRRFMDCSPELNFGAPEFCLFDDMLSFRTQFLLTRRRSSGQRP